MPSARRRHDREIFRLAVPAFGALVAEPLYILADTAVVGHLGTAQLGGLAIASSALLGGYALFIFLAYGMTATVSRLIGAGEHTEAAHQAGQGLWLAGLIGAGLVAIGALAADPIVGALGGTGAVRHHALIYFRVSLAGVPAFLLTMAGAGYLRGVQNTIGPLAVAGVTAVLNLVLELTLIYGFGYGIGASALATVIAQWLGAAAYIRWVVRGAREHGASLRPDWRGVGRLARAGTDLLLRTAALRLAIIMSTAVAARIGVVELGAHQIAFELWSFLALMLDAVAIAGQAMTGRLLGADDPAQARDVGRRMVEWAVVLGVAFGLLVAASHAWLPGIFTSDPDVEHLAAFVLFFVAGLQPVNAVVFALDGVLIGAGDARYLARAMTVAVAAFAPMAVAVAVLDLGIGWLWATIGLLMVARLIALVTRFRSDDWLVVGARLEGGTPS